MLVAIAQSAAWRHITDAQMVELALCNAQSAYNLTQRSAARQHTVQHTDKVFVEMQFLVIAVGTRFFNDRAQDGLVAQKVI